MCRWCSNGTFMQQFSIELVRSAAADGQCFDRSEIAYHFKRDFLICDVRKLHKDAKLVVG